MLSVKEEDIKVRVPGTLKSALSRIAEARLTTVSEVAREALIAYLVERGVTVQSLREEEVAASPSAAPPAKPGGVSYRKTKRKS